MLDKTYMKQLRKTLHDYAAMRREIIKMSGDALHHAKRAIFSMHREDIADAKKKTAEAKHVLQTLHKKYARIPNALEEGAYKAALEEYVEAFLLHEFFAGKKMGKIADVPVDRETFLAGLCDVPGELYRFAIRAATAGDKKMVDYTAEVASEIIGSLVEFDLTKYLRTKFDQAKHALQKLEIVQYELSLRGKK